ncbi:MAG TPA: guanylate kinase [Parafilimonas sp.]|nr:guanylate kinase [Parafilimonas sp.]
MTEHLQKLIIITAPSGAGKTSVTKYLLGKIPQLAFSVSATTRKPRSNETNAVDYYFITEGEFHTKIQENDFIEWEMVYEGKYYGTFKSELERIWKENKIPLLDIDVKGAIHVHEQYDSSCLTIFIEPPSVEELKKRLQSRGTESLESLQTRLNKAVFELSFKNQFNKIIINDNLQHACLEAEAAVTEFLGL